MALDSQGCKPLVRMANATMESRSDGIGFDHNEDATTVRDAINNATAPPFLIRAHNIQRSATTIQGLTPLAIEYHRSAIPEADRFFHARSDSPP